MLCFLIVSIYHVITGYVNKCEMGQEWDIENQGCSCVKKWEKVSEADGKCHNICNKNQVLQDNGSCKPCANEWDIVNSDNKCANQCPNNHQWNYETSSC